MEARLTARTGRTRPLYAKEAFLEHLGELEDKYLAINRLENPGRCWTLDELEQDLDLDR
ncbi:MAG: anti-toxin [Gammaproteobacteria bacterium]|nr:anti-toxin [Gammaproteobacteria bacterium]